MRFSLIFILFFYLIHVQAQESSDSRFEALTNKFGQGLEALEIPAISLDFKTHLRNQLESQNLQAQKGFFLQIERELKTISFEKLTQSLKLDYRIIQFEAENNLERIALIENFNADFNAINKATRIYELPNGQAWYAYSVKKWTGSDLSLEEIMDFGLKEIERVKTEISKLNLTNPKPETYFTQNKSEIESKLQRKLKQINQSLPKLFPDFKSLPKLNIEQGTNAQLAQAPGYYSSNTFYYNLFDKPFDLADTDWLLIHEGNPGHHFQVSFHNQLEVKPYRENLQYMGFIEGWAAYVENLGKEMGLYTDPYEELAKWNWDLIRSTRVYLDVAINYLGWSDEQALEFWKEHIKNQDDIGLREIARMKRWPAQVLSYKLGEGEMLKALKREKEIKRDHFNYKEFHTQLLKYGTVPPQLIPLLFELY